MALYLIRLLTRFWRCISKLAKEKPSVFDTRIEPAPYDPNKPRPDLVRWYDYGEGKCKVLIFGDSLITVAWMYGDFMFGSIHGAV